MHQLLTIFTTICVTIVHTTSLGVGTTATAATATAAAVVTCASTTTTGFSQLNDLCEGVYERVCETAHKRIYIARVRRSMKGWMSGV